MASIRSVYRGHQGKYTCVMTDHHGNQFYNTATLHVKEKGNFLLIMSFSSVSTLSLSSGDVDTSSNGTEYFSVVS